MQVQHHLCQLNCISLYSRSTFLVQAIVSANASGDASHFRVRQILSSRNAIDDIDVFGFTIKRSSREGSSGGQP